MQKFKAKEKVVLGVLCILALVLSLRSVERSAAVQEKMIPGKKQSDMSGEIHMRYDTPPTPLKGFAGLAESINIPKKTTSANVEGSVFVTVLIDNNGKAEISSDLRTKGDCGYAEKLAVIDALKKSQWNPALKKGEPIESKIDLIFVFKLNEDTDKIYIEVIPPPPPPPIPPQAPKTDVPISPKNPPPPPLPNSTKIVSPRDVLVPSSQISPRPNVPLPPKVSPSPSFPPEPALLNKNKPIQPHLEKAIPFPAQPPKPAQPLEPETLVLASSVPLPEPPPPPGKAIPFPPPIPYTPWENPDYQSNQELDKKPEPSMGMDYLTQKIHDSPDYKENKNFAQSKLIIGVLVEETGKLNAVLILQSSGHRDLDQTIIEYLLAEDWKPGEKDGKPVKAKTTFTFSFEK